MKKLFTLLLSVSAFCSATITANAQVDINDSLALVDLYNSTNGTNWANNSNWLTGPVKRWYGIALTSGRVTSIGLGYNNLSGVLPSSIGNLSNLLNLSLSYDQLSGNIPPELGNLSYLQFLLLDHNQLSGNIPSELGNCNLLEYLFLNNNQLSGSIPLKLGKLSDLEYLRLEYNQLSGSIPHELGNLSNLKYLDLAYNQLTGSIPSEIGNLSQLYLLQLNNNSLSGAIPSFDALYYNNATINFSYNKFTFEGMEKIAQRFFNALYDHQARITVNTNGNVLSVSAGGTLSNNTYLWVKKGQKDVIRITGDSTFHPIESGTYVVRVKNKIATDLVLTSNIIHYTAPFTVDAITSNKTTILNDAFSVYPNPVKDVLHVTTNGSASFSLVSKSGKVLFTTNIDKTGTINVSTLAAGEYYLRNNNTNAAQKVVVIK